MPIEIDNKTGSINQMIEKGFSDSELDTTNEYLCSQDVKKMSVTDSLALLGLNIIQGNKFGVLKVMRIV